MKTINEDIKTQNFKSCYLILGEEDYLKKQYRDKLVKALVAEGDTINYNYFEGKGISVNELIGLADTMPFFAERRLIVVENSNLFKSGGNDLAEYIKNIPDTVVVLFVESEVDKRSKLYKAVKSGGYICEMKKQDEKTLVMWIAGQVKREGHVIRESTVRYLIGRVGTDMNTIAIELEKLFSYTLGQKEITQGDVEEICTIQIQNQIFAMVEAVAQKQQKKALDYYYDLLALKEPPMRILFMLTRQFKQLLEVKTLMAMGYDREKIAKEAGIHPFVTKKYMSQCRAFDTKELINILEDAADTEERVKTGRLTDLMSVELFIVKYSRM